LSISDKLKSDLICRPIEQVFQKHVIDGNSYFFTEILKNIDLEYELRNNLSDVLSVNINDIVIVGSAKLGFSLKTKEFNDFDKKFKLSSLNKDKSDIDIAVINKGFFDKTSFEIYNYSKHFDKTWTQQNWTVNQYHNTYRNLSTDYMKYLAKGWIRPDYLPNSYLSQQPWLIVCNNWYRKSKFRKISIGFYSDWMYFKNYQMDQLLSIKNQIEKLEA
jgi:hypothetical protein